MFTIGEYPICDLDVPLLASETRLHALWLAASPRFPSSAEPMVFRGPSYLLLVL